MTDKSLHRETILPFPFIECIDCKRFHFKNVDCLDDEEKSEAISFPCYWAKRSDAISGKVVNFPKLLKSKKCFPFLDLFVPMGSLQYAIEESDRRFLE